MTVPVVAIAYCSKCGRKSRIDRATLDVRHPMVNCVGVESDGDDTGDGLVVGTFDADEASGLVTARARKRETGRHAKHEKAGRPSPLCDKCPPVMPARPTRPHPLEEFDTKYRLASHLELTHGDGSLRPRLPIRSLGELDSYHRRLHEALR